MTTLSTQWTSPDVDVSLALMFLVIPPSLPGAMPLAPAPRGQRATDKTGQPALTW
jgi:hypothetical protein